MTLAHTKHVNYPSSDPTSHEVVASLGREDATNEPVTMSESKDPLLRNLALLQLIPRLPDKRSTSVLMEKLRDKGFSVDIRSLQRDLNRLSVQFPIVCHDDTRPYQWSLDKGAQINLLAPDIPEALALCLAEKYLENVLPQGVMCQLSARFTAAREYLEKHKHNDLACWPQRVRTLPNGKALIPATIAQDI